MNDCNNFTLNDLNNGNTELVVDKKKENIANYILSPKSEFEIKSIDDLKKFFKLMEPLNDIFKVSMKYWEINEYDNGNIITFHNDISKIYYNFTYDEYIIKIRKKLEQCKIEFYYYETKEYRYNKTKEIIFAFRSEKIEK